MKKHAKIKFLHKRKVIILSLIGTVFITSGALAYSLTTNTQQTKPMAIVQVQTTTPTPSTTPIAPPTSTPTPTVTSTTQPIETSESPSPSPALAPGVDINKIPYYTDTNPYSSGSVMGYIFDNRKSTGKPIGAWGNISYSSWRLYGVQSGYIVDSMPEVGAIALSMINRKSVV